MKSANKSASRRKNGDGRITLTVRVPKSVLQQIDDDIAAELVPVSRNNWLVEAAVRKLRKKIAEGKDGPK
jgi:hypothetical protein